MTENAPTNLLLDDTTRALIELWSKHHASNPNIPDDYATHIDHLRARQDEWQRQEDAWRVVVSARLATIALNETLEGLTP